MVPPGLELVGASSVVVVVLLALGDFDLSALVVLEAAFLVFVAVALPRRSWFFFSSSDVGDVDRSAVIVGIVLPSLVRAASWVGSDWARSRK